MITKEPLEVVGLEWDVARRRCEQAGLTVRCKQVGPEVVGAPLRVIRQRSPIRGTIELTCARENWQAIR